MNEQWPSLPLDGWREPYATLPVWTQIVGFSETAVKTASADLAGWNREALEHSRDPGPEDGR